MKQELVPHCSSQKCQGNKNLKAKGVIKNIDRVKNGNCLDCGSVVAMLPANQKYRGGIEWKGNPKQQGIPWV